MYDIYDQVYDKFMYERQYAAQGLFERFKGPMPALIVDTNDPINMHRVRVRIPELHDSDLPVEQCPWARPAAWMGGTESGSWTSYCIGDLVYVLFEKNHPYMPMYIGSADATRRARYVTDSVYARSPTVLDIDGKQDEVMGQQARDNGKIIYDDAGDPLLTEKDYVEEWLPHDRRPMSTGMKDRYGHLFMMKSVGFFPSSHTIKPGINGLDPVRAGELDNSRDLPGRNEPDAKYLIQMTKYGNYGLFSDVGYQWWNEFESEWDSNKLERIWERKRTNYYTKLHTEETHRDRDQRRLEFRTRYGHLIECRDVGWSRSREGEFGGSQDIADNRIAYGSESSEVDHRWIKIRTKGGHLFQMYDKGFDPIEDELIAKTASNGEFGEFMDQECPSSEETPFGYGWWHDRDDARFMRMVSRYGYKFAIDDRGSSSTRSHLEADQHGNGIILKGRRRGLDSVERGFGLEFNEKDKLNHLMAYTPKAKVVEMNDKYDYTMIHSGHRQCDQDRYNLSERWAARGDNEFSGRIAMWNLHDDLSNDPELHSNHLKLDKSNGYVRLKTESYGIPAGLESRMGGTNGHNWTEINDHFDRGLWFTQDGGHGIPLTGSVWRSETLSQDPTVEPTMWQAMDEGNGQALIVNNGDVTQIYVSKNLEIIAGDEIMLKCGSKFSISASSVEIDAGASHVLNSSGIGTTGDMYCGSYHGYKIGCMTGPGASSPSPSGGSPSTPTKRSLPVYKPGPEFDDRAKDNHRGSYERIDRTVDIWNDS